MHFSYFLLFFENIFKQNPLGPSAVQKSRLQIYFHSHFFHCPAQTVHWTSEKSYLIGNLTFLENMFGPGRALNKTIREEESVAKHRNFYSKFIKVLFFLPFPKEWLTAKTRESSNSQFVGVFLPLADKLICRHFVASMEIHNPSFPFLTSPHFCAPLCIPDRSAGAFLQQCLSALVTGFKLPISALKTQWCCVWDT